jgi:peroxiredoxin
MLFDTPRIRTKLELSHSIFSSRIDLARLKFATIAMNWARKHLSHFREEHNMKWSVTISACCVVLLGVNIALLHQNRQLKAQLSQPPPALELATGTRMPDLRGFDPDGKPVEVVYGKDPRKVLVLVFSPTCPFCEQNWPKWEQVISSLDRSVVRPVGVDVTSTSQAPFLSQHQLTEMPVLEKVDPKVMMNYHFQLTPQTILLDPAGKVEKVWTGVMTDSAVSDLKQRMDGSKTASASSARATF